MSRTTRTTSYSRSADFILGLTFEISHAHRPGTPLFWNDKARSSGSALCEIEGSCARCAVATGWASFSSFFGQDNCAREYVKVVVLATDGDPTPQPILDDGSFEQKIRAIIVVFAEFDTCTCNEPGRDFFSGGGAQRKRNLAGDGLDAEFRSQTPNCEPKKEFHWPCRSKGR